MLRSTDNVVEDNSTFASSLTQAKHGLAALSTCLQHLTDFTHILEPTLHVTAHCIKLAILGMILP
jgi:hypothetical protein